MRKIIFLDIDGTLVDFHENMPKSTRLALEKAKQNGHYLVICTGRIYSGIYDWLLDFGFDGVVASAGAHVVWHGEELFHSYIPKEKLKKVKEVLDKHNAFYVFQGVNGRFADERNSKRMHQYYAKKGVDLSKKKFRESVCDKPYNRSDIESGVYYQADVGVDEIRKEMDEAIQITGASFGDEHIYNGEFTYKGINKATGMQKVLDHIGLAREDVIAFGDSPNDFEMIEFANVGVAMGNAVDELKELADMVTDNILDDGIYKGFQRLKIIE